MPAEKTKEQDKHTKDYFDQLGWDIEKQLKQARLLKEAQLPSIKIPNIEESEEDENDKKPPIVPKLEAGIVLPDVEDNIGDEEQLVTDLEAIKDSLTEIEFNEKVEQIKEDMRDEFEQVTKDLQKELDNLKDRKIPEIKNFDSGGVYREAIFDIVTRVLDEILVNLFDDVPDYSLIANQVSRTFEDGTVSDAVVAVAVTVPNEGYRYDFKIDVPILNGIVHYPTYIQRGLKVIPLTKEKIMEELDSTAFRKIDIEEPYGKRSIYNNTEDNVHKKPDNQKWYDIYGTKPIPSAIPEKSKWDPKINKRRQLT